MHWMTFPVFNIEYWPHNNKPSQSKLLCYVLLMLSTWIYDNVIISELKWSFSNRHVECHANLIMCVLYALKEHWCLVSRWCSLWGTWHNFMIFVRGKKKIDLLLAHHNEISHKMHLPPSFCHQGNNNNNNNNRKNPIDF